MSVDPIALMEKLTVPLMEIARTAKVAMTMVGTVIAKAVITVREVLAVLRIITIVRDMLLTREMARLTPLRRMERAHRPVPFAKDAHGWVRHV